MPETTNNPKCPYCGNTARLFKTSEAFYNGRDYGPLWACVPCEAWVGCHKGTFVALGRLANTELRKAKQRAHAAFDPIWKARLARRRAEDSRYTKGMARGGRYKALAELLGIPRAVCHIGMFDVDLCNRTVEIIAAGRLEA